MKNIYRALLLFILFSGILSSQWLADVRLTNNPSYTSTYYNNAWSIAANGNSVHTVFTDLRDGNNEIYYKRSTDAGTSWGSDTRITNNSSASWNTSLAVSSQTVHVIWIDNRDGNNEIYYKRSTDNGTTWGTDIRLTDDAAFSEFPSITVSGLAVHVVWTDNRDANNEIYYKTSTDGGVTWGSETRLTNNSALSLTPSVAVSGTTVHVVWRDNRDGNYEIYYKRSTNGGVSWGTDIRLVNNSFDSGDPDLTVSGSNVYASWMDIRDSYWAIYIKRSTDAGITWSADERVTDNTNQPAFPNLSASGVNVHLVWQDYRDGNNEIYYKRSINNGINWGGDVRLSNNSAVSEIPSICVSESAVHVVWTDERDGNRELYYKKDPAGNPVAIENISSEIPVKMYLEQNYPNPFNPITNFIFQIPKSEFVKVAVYDINGKELEILVSSQLSAGTYKAEWDASLYPSGIYFYTLTAGNFSQTKKMMLVK